MSLASPQPWRQIYLTTGPRQPEAEVIGAHPFEKVLPAMVAAEGVRP